MHGLADARTFGLMMRANWPDVRLSVPVPDQGMDWLVRFPAGRTLDVAGALAVQAHPLKTAGDGSVYLPVVGGHRLDQLAATSHRGMLAGVEQQPQEPARLYGVDLREAHRKIAHSSGVPSAVVIPRAYEIDDLTYGIIWAVTSLDDALLADDSALDQWQQQLREFEQLPHSAAGSQAAAGLTAAARMWLGSSFCARHILRNLASPQGLPAFWTREQTGEEACAWLLFRHKHTYLQQISGQFAGTADPLVRGFCVPEDAVMASVRWERVLLSSRSRLWSPWASVSRPAPSRSTRTSTGSSSCPVSAPSSRPGSGLGASGVPTALAAAQPSAPSLMSPGTSTRTQ